MLTRLTSAERDPERVRCPTHDYAGAVKLSCADREPKKLRDTLGSFNFDQGTDSRAISNQAIYRLQLLAHPKLARTKNITSDRGASLDFHRSSSSSHQFAACQIRSQSFAADFAFQWQP